MQSNNYVDSEYIKFKKDFFKDLDCDWESKHKISDVIIPQIRMNLESYKGEKPANWEDLLYELNGLLFSLMRTISKSNSYDRRPKIGENYESPLSLFNRFMPTNFIDGFPKGWWRTSHYAPYHMDHLQDDYKEYKTKPYLRCDYLDYLFLKYFTYGCYSTDYFILLFRKGLPTIKYGLMEVITNGAITKIYLFKLIANLISFLLFIANPTIAFFSFSYGISWLGWIFTILTGFSIISLPYSIYNYFFRVKKWEKNYINKIEVSFKAYDHITNSNINPEILKKIITKNETDYNIFLDTSVYAIVDDLIAKHKNYFDPLIIK